VETCDPYEETPEKFSVATDPYEEMPVKFSKATDPYEDIKNVNENEEEPEETTVLLTKDATIKRIDEIRNKEKNKKFFKMVEKKDHLQSKRQNKKQKSLN